MRVFAVACLALLAGCVSGPPRRMDVPRARTPPRIDGDLNDAAWASSAVIPRLEPARGGDPARTGAAGDTTVRLLWDASHLFVAFECRDDDIRTSAEIPRDGDIYERDVVEVFLDPDGSADPVYEIVVSPLNQILDAVHLLSAPPEMEERGKMPDAFLKRHFWSFRSRDLEGLRTAARKVETGWRVELAIPAHVVLRTLGRDAFESGDRIRANFLRYDWGESPADERRLRQGNWSPVVTGCPHISPGLMGELRLL